MGTKNNPGSYDCYANADPDEPMFILLARDPLAPILVELWATLREQQTPVGSPQTYANKVAEARNCAKTMRVFRTSQKET